MKIKNLLKDKGKSIFQKVGHVIEILLFHICLFIVGICFLEVFLFASFKIPTSSMEPKVMSGDHILVFKLIPGPRLFNLFKSIKGNQTKIYRLPGIRHIKRNDIVVFHSIHPHSWDKIEMHILNYMIKRCIGIPGDSVEIKNGFYYIKGSCESFGNIGSLHNLSIHKKSYLRNTFNMFPQDSILNWNIKDFGPIYLPQKGDTIFMNRTHYLLYKQQIEWEQKSTLIYLNSVVYLNNQPLTFYIFKKNYYFMAGDNTEESLDSRYWGLLPEEYIVGRAFIIWKSIDPWTKKIRWERFLKSL